MGKSLLLLAAALLLACSSGAAHAAFNRSSFPKGFIFGTGSSAIQYEGAVNLRGKNIWDTFAHIPGKIEDGSTPDIANDMYNRYKEQLQLINDMNMDSFRFSISWARILPTGSVAGGISKDGVEFYNSLINETLNRGLVPYVTLFHFDTPQELEDKYGGFRSQSIIEDFVGYADVCFKLFGDRVKMWTTFNEPYIFSTIGYGIGVSAPGRCSSWLPNNCSGGDSGTEPYTVGHNMLLAHAEAVALYRTKYQKKDKGQIGITQVSHWFVPYNEPADSEDRRAVKRALDFMIGWFMQPIISGQYPATMRRRVGSRLPEFTVEQSEKLKRSFDFLGINYYTSNYAKSMPPSNGPPFYFTDTEVNQTGVRNGVPIGPPSEGVPNFYSYPAGLRKLLLYLKNTYVGNTPIHITENGISEASNTTMPIEEVLKDGTRITFHEEHLKFVRMAIKEGVNVTGYFTWTFMDCFEFGRGYQSRFGLVYVNRTTLQTYRKDSSYWIEKFLKKN